MIRKVYWRIRCFLLHFVYLMTLLKNICVKLNKLKLNKLAGLLRTRQWIFYRYLLAYVYKPLTKQQMNCHTRRNGFSLAAMPSPAFSRTVRAYEQIQYTNHQSQTRTVTQLITFSRLKWQQNTVYSIDYNASTEYWGRADILVLLLLSRG